MRSRSLLDAKQKIFTYNHTSKSLFWNCFSKYTSQSLYLIALATGEFVGSFQKCLHIEALEKAKPYPHFQKLPSANKKKKPLSRRVNHALIAAILYLLYLLSARYSTSIGSAFSSSSRLVPRSLSSSSRVII